MKSIAGILGLLVFLAIVAWAAGNYISDIKANVTTTKCTDARQALGLCE